MHLLTEQERLKISEAIKSAEKLTACEIVVTEIKHCDDYNSARFLWGLIIALSTTLVIYFFTSFATSWLILTEILGFLVGFIGLAHISSLKRLLVSRVKMHNEAHTRALAEFYEQGLYKTREANGILIMLAVFERKVIILDDHGVNKHVTAEYWETMANRIVRGVKEQQAGEAICGTIMSLADDLKQHYPPRPDDSDELPDGVVVK